MSKNICKFSEKLNNMWIYGIRDKSTITTLTDTLNYNWKTTAEFEDWTIRSFFENWLSLSDLLTLDILALLPLLSLSLSHPHPPARAYRPRNWLFLSLSQELGHLKRDWERREKEEDEEDRLNCCLWNYIGPASFARILRTWPLTEVARDAGARGWGQTEERPILAVRLHHELVLHCTWEVRCGGVMNSFHSSCPGLDHAHNWLDEQISISTLQLVLVRLYIQDV